MTNSKFAVRTGKLKNTRMGQKSRGNSHVKADRKNSKTHDDLHSQAEKYLATSTDEARQMPVNDMHRLVHELQVHHIELEMQNDELRRTQLELEAARQRLVLPYDAAPVGFVTVNAEGVILEANLAAARLVNFDRRQLTGRTLARFIAPESREDFYLHCRQLVGTGEKQTSELRMLRMARQPFEARLESVADRVGAERASRFLVMISDITERKQAEDILRQARAELEQRVRERTKELTCTNTALRAEKAFSDSLIELAPAVVAVIDDQGQLMRTNAYGEQLAGYRIAEIQGRSMIDLFVPPEEQRRVRHLLQEAAQGRAVQALVVPLRTRDGSIRQIEWSSKPLSSVAGEPSATLVIGHDITGRKRMEDGLRRSEHHLSNFFNLAPIGLAWLSPIGIVLRVNQAHLDLLGYTEKEYVGHSFLESCTDLSQGRELLERLARKEIVRNLRMVRRRKDGAIRHVLVDANPFWSDNQFQYSSIFSRDVTDRVNLEHEVLHISEREQRRIAQDLHDGLGQLLVGARYLAGTLRQDLTAKSPVEGRTAGRILEVLAEAVSQTRDLARGLHPVAAEPIGLMAALEALAARTQKLFKLECRFRRRRPVLIQDNALATHLFRIAQESVTNAIKHGKPGRVEISLTGTPGRIVLAVKDDGKGLPARPRKHTGMGLRIMRYRASMIGGSLAVQKAAGSGTNVICTVDLPGAGRPLKPPKLALNHEKGRRD